MLRVANKMVGLIILSFTVSSAFAVGPHLCAKELDETSISRLSKKELVQSLCFALINAQVAQTEGDAISKALDIQEPSFGNSEEGKKKWAGLLAKGMYSMVERDTCINKARIYFAAYRTKYGSDPRCVSDTSPK